nr:MAG TPA: hypothetical protein [Caudoviricetes sp.]
MKRKIRSCWSIYDDRTTSCAEISPFLRICDRVVFRKMKR